MTKPAITPLRLLAQDYDDLRVISASLQDAVAKVGDIKFEKAAGRLTIVFNRYRWESGRGERVRSALQLGSVLAVSARAIRAQAKDAVLELLAITFDESDAPGGAVTLSFAGGGDIRVTVECIEAILADVSAPWPTPRRPRHQI